MQKTDRGSEVSASRGQKGPDIMTEAQEGI
jgi:hypothetical protein